MPKTHQQNLGRQGEQLIEAYLDGKGYILLERNFLKRSGEIDLIAEKDEEVIFIEVKTRQTSTFGYPEESVGPWKLHKIEKTAHQWLRQNKKLDRPWRIDIIALEINQNNKITHLKNVTI